MVRLPFFPDYFPVLLLPLYWVFWFCFYVWYLPFYALVILFSPYRSSKRLYEFYQRRFSKVKRDLSSSSVKGNG